MNGAALRPSVFNVFVDALFDDCTIAFNTCSGAFRALDGDDFDALTKGLDGMSVNKALVENLHQDGFLVDKNLDEYTHIQDKYATSYAQTDGLALTIAPTVDCNFGCSYCFQEHTNDRMSQQDQTGLIRYVEQNLKPNTSLSITWFGGEPLTAFSIVEDLSQALTKLAKDRNCLLNQAIISNGYLLNEKRITTLATLENLTLVQITLDGPADIHDKRRTTKGKNLPTFSRILDNVAKAASRLSITLRINVDKTNIGGLEALVDEIIARGLKNKVGLYLGHTLPYTEVCGNMDQTAFSREEFASVDAGFKLYLVQMGFQNVVSLPRPQSSSLCIADHPQGRVISPHGAVFRCWNETALAANEAVAHLDENGALAGSDNDRAKIWDGFNPFSHDPCKTCTVMPLCKGGCPWEAIKNSKNEPGHCTHLRWTLPDILRLYHLETTVRTSLKKIENAHMDYPCA